MSLLVIGTVAYDSIESPYGNAPDTLGGSGTYFASSASFYTPTQVVGVVGADFDLQELDYLRAQGVDFEGLEVDADGKTFRWGGKYMEDVNQRETLFTDLNVLETFSPKLPESYRQTDIVFLANFAPQLQSQVLDQLSAPKFVVMDTMNLWIDIAMDDVKAVLKRVDGVIVNDEETRMLSGELNLVAGAKKLLEMGPRLVICKKGEHGAFLLSKDDFFSIPAYPTTAVKDPTGAGDSFAGGMMGYIAATGNSDFATVKTGLAHGSAAASFCVEEFGVGRFKTIDKAAIESRVEKIRGYTAF
jgi:cytidine kinase